MAPRAVLFDFDGVIADTENHHIAAWQRTLMALGWQVPDEIAARSAEIDDRDSSATCSRPGDRGRRHRGLGGKKASAHDPLLRDAPRSIPGWPIWSGSFAAGSGWRSSPAPGARTSRPCWPQRGCLGAFELIVAKEDVAAVKPDPEAYLLALERLGTRPAKAVASRIPPRVLPPSRGDPGSPSATAANSATGSAMTSTSPGSSPSPDCSTTWAWVEQPAFTGADLSERQWGSIQFT